MSKEYVVKYVCDTCGNRIEDESLMTTVKVTGPVKDVDGEFHLCADHAEGLASVVGMAQHFRQPQTRARKYGRGKGWTEEEDALLLESRDEGLTHDEIAELLPGRSAKAVNVRVYRLKALKKI